jgi:hypothetical protein
VAGEGVHFGFAFERVHRHFRGGKHRILGAAEQKYRCDRRWRARREKSDGQHYLGKDVRQRTHDLAWLALGRFM